VRAAAIGIVALLSSTARANPMDAFGFGSRAISLGGAVTASVEDSAANYYNPAGLARGRDLEIDIGYGYAQPRLRLNGRDVGVDGTHGFALGLVAPGAIGPFRFAFGLSLWLPDDRLTRVRTLAFDTPRFVLYDNRTQRLLLSANLAIQIVPGLYLGGGLTFMSRTLGDLFLKGQVAVSDPDVSALTSKIDVSLAAIRYPQVGLLWEVTRALSLAVSYRHSFKLVLDQAFRIDGSIGDPDLPPVVPTAYLSGHAISTDLFQPWQLTLGVAARLYPTLLVTADGTYARYSEFPVPAPAFTIGIDVGQFNDRVHLPPTRAYPAPGFHDIFIPRLGVEWRALDAERLALDVRGGYSYEASPVPEQIGESSLVDGDKHTFSLGLGLTAARFTSILPRPISIDVHLAFTYVAERYDRKLDPRDPTGDLRSDGWIANLGATLRARF
jgi:long-chain fatty acid transport protein